MRAVGSILVASYTRRKSTPRFSSCVKHCDAVPIRGGEGPALVSAHARTRTCGRKQTRCARAGGGDGGGERGRATAAGHF